MADRPSQEFRFGDDDRPETLIQRRKKSKPARKSGNKAVFFFLFVLVILGGMFAMAYLDIKARVAELESVRQTEDEKLAEVLDRKVTGMLSQYKDLEESLTKRVFPMDEIFLALESTTSTLKKELTAIEGRVEALAQGKADRKALTGAVEKLEAAVETLGDRLEEKIDGVDPKIREIREEMTRATAEVSRKATELEASVKKETALLTEAIETNREKLTALETTVVSLSADQLDREELTSGLDELEKDLRGRINQVSGQIKSRTEEMRSLARKLDRVEKIAEGAAARIREVSSAKTIEAPPQPGTFIEQDLQ